ncbi:sensor histidine kinase [Nocardiopsis algeriensis]|uniref:Signal transduction histidine kinase n=1 Tax=Nocardiopsis algeriensis TaxID=1478215 RepID=A0A841IQS4_9ACTN|nr:sensor histidine kinase [Nocardiopsis algeriensis]MBB6120472.1 signal transduction histidine kinase [Nocardiopsis algeriensis]
MSSTEPAEARPLLPGPGGTERHAWDLGTAWYIFFAVVLTVFGAVCVVAGEGWRGWSAAGLLAAVGLLHLTVGRWIQDTDRYATPVSGVFALAVAALLVVGVHLVPFTAFALLAVAPMCFMTAGALYGTLSVGLVLLAPLVSDWAAGRTDTADALVAAGVHLVVLGFAYWFGSWFQRVVAQSYERSELLRQLRESRAEAVRLSEESGALAERERLARELHDTLAQGLTSIIALTQAVESEMGPDPGLARRHLALMRATASENLAEARAMVAARRPVPLEENTLDAALVRIATALGAELGITVDTAVTGVGPRELPSPSQVCLLRTAQEALANVRKHAGARRVEVSLSYTDVGVRLTVADDGRGFDPGASTGGNGLANMRHRAEEAGGVLDIDTAPGEGTAVRLSLLHDDEEEGT